jgi:branched-chain amino acid aminotransferase
MAKITLWKLTHRAGKQTISALKVAEDLETLDAVSVRIPNGAYTTLRTFLGSKVVRLEDHLKRLDETALLSGKTIQMDHDLIRKMMRQAIREFDGEDLRLRVTVDLESSPGDIYCATVPLVLPPLSDYIKGIRVTTCYYARQNPKGKFTRFIIDAHQLRQSKHPDAGEMIMVAPSGQILEGLTSNFFGIQAGIIHTSGAGILSGITRTLVLEEAERSGMVVDYGGVMDNEIARLDEAFITSSSRGILPVTMIDDQVIGSGKPGEYSVQLARMYKMRVELELEDI